MPPTTTQGRPLLPPMLSLVPNMVVLMAVLLPFQILAWVSLEGEMLGPVLSATASAVATFVLGGIIMTVGIVHVRTESHVSVRFASTTIVAVLALFMYNLFVIIYAVAEGGYAERSGLVSIVQCLWTTILGFALAATVLHFTVNDGSSSSGPVGYIKHGTAQLGPFGALIKACTVFVLLALIFGVPALAIAPFTIALATWGECTGEWWYAPPFAIVLQFCVIGMYGLLHQMGKQGWDEEQCGRPPLESAFVRIKLALIFSATTGGVFLTLFTGECPQSSVGWVVAFADVVISCQWLCIYAHSWLMCRSFIGSGAPSADVTGAAASQTEHSSLVAHKAEFV